MKIPRSSSLFIYMSILVILGFGYNGNAQNLVPNPSFEIFTTCPSTYQGICDGFAPPWTCGSTGSVDLFNACGGSGSMMYVPDNVIGSQPAITGDGYAGLLCRWPTANYREYLMVQITPLTAGTWYYLSFYVSLAETACGVEHIGAYFGVNNPYMNNWFVMPVEPQIETNNGFISDKENWVLISGCFQAAGGEQYLVIGNFRDDAESPLDPNCGGYSYYYIEDVSLFEGGPPEENELDLGGPVTACFSYEIEPDNPGPIFIWSDGSHLPTLNVTESGTYALTVTDGCTAAEDSIEVTILGTDPPVDAGPDQVVICNGDSYTISLDPDLAEYTWNDGSNDPEYTITTAGTYSVTLDDGCLATSDEITIDILYVPDPFDLGDDYFLCLGDETTISFDPSLGDFVWQDGSTSSEFTITSGGEYALTINNMCGQESDEILVTDLEVPEIEIGPDEQLLCDGEILEIEIDPALGDILWQDGSNQPNYEITTPGIYTVFVTNQCGTGSDQIEVSTLNSPDTYLGNDTTLCEGDMLILSVDSPEGLYLWQDNSTGAQFQVTTPGTYGVTISNLCGTVSDNIVVDYTSLVVPPDFGPDVTLCPGEQIVLQAGNPGAAYLWQDMSTSDSLVVTSPGTYSVQVSNTCGTTADTINVNYNDIPPQVDLPAQLSLCQGESLTLDAAISGVTYLWNDNSQNQQLTVNAPGTYSVTVSNACGTDVDTTIILDGGPAPAVALGNDIAICPGETVQLTPVSSNVDTWLWQDGSTLPSYTVASAGVITVEVDNACSTAYDTLNVSLLPATPPLDLGVDTSLCAGQSFTLSINTPGVTILWPDGSTGTAYTVSGPGQVYASVSNSCGTSSDTIDVAALPDIPALNLGADQSLCPGELITLNPGIANVQYSWQDGSTGNSFQATQQTTVILTITNACGTSTDTLEIIESTQGPQVNLGADIQVCAGEVVTIPSGISGVNYVWQDGSTNPSYTTTQSGVFSLQVSNNCGTDSDTIAVDISGVAPSVALGPDTTLCEGITLQLMSNADAITSIEWQDGSSSQTYNITSPGIYSLAESNRCGDATDTIKVNYLDAPDPFTLGADTTLCPGETITLTAPSAAYDILWQDGSDQLSFIADQAATYSLQLSNDCGTVTDQLVLNFDTRVPQLNLDSSIPWCEGDVITLDATQPFVASYAWSTGAISPVITVSSPGLYSIDVNTPCSSASQNIEVLPGPDCVIPEVHTEIYIPNVFSPNGDGVNDVFSVSFGSDLIVTGMEGSIYDRWGNLVFSSTAIPFTWDGQFDLEYVMPGVYVYLIKVNYMIGTEEHERVFSGDVTVLR